MLESCWGRRRRRRKTGKQSDVRLKLENEKPVHCILFLCYDTDTLRRSSTFDVIQRFHSALDMFTFLCFYILFFFFQFQFQFELEIDSEFQLVIHLPEFEDET